MMKKQSTKKEAAEKEKEYFLKVIDQQKVDDITVDFFYRSHTASLLIFLLLVFYLLHLSAADNYYHGALTVCGVFLLLSTMILPNGPFIRPHPAIWRIIFGVSLLYFLVLVFVLFMKVEDARAVLHYIDPSLKNMTIHDILDKDYAVNCSQVTIKRVYSHLDVFALAHFLGWVVKAVLLRHYWLTWLLSINWEITELVFCHMMPNFCECWWDSLFLDIIICNGVGIFAGMKFVQWLEMRTYHWESIRHMRSTGAKIKRLVLQFTPASWYPTSWFDQDSGIKRGITLSCLVVVWQFAELNAFFLKHVFIVRPSHVLTIGRLALITLISAPGIRQFYLFVTDPMINRIGSQLWMFLAVVMTEFVVCLKFGFETFEKTILLYLVFWVVWLVLSSFATVFLCLWFSRHCLGRSVLPRSPRLLSRLTSPGSRIIRCIMMRPPSSSSAGDSATVVEEEVLATESTGDRNHTLYSEPGVLTNGAVMLMASEESGQVVFRGQQAVSDDEDDDDEF